jgi:hypothetical protein
VLEMRRRVLGDEHPDTFVTMGNLASTYYDQGRWKEAEVLQVQALEMRRVLGDGHPDTLTAIANLAATYCKQQQWAKAKGLAEELLVLQKQVLGDDHPDTLATIAHLRSYTWFHSIKQLPSKLKDKVHHIMQ